MTADSLNDKCTACADAEGYCPKHDPRKVAEPPIDNSIVAKLVKEYGHILDGWAMPFEPEQIIIMIAGGYLKYAREQSTPDLDGLVEKLEALGPDFKVAGEPLVKLCDVLAIAHQHEAGSSCAPTQNDNVLQDQQREISGITFEEWYAENSGRYGLGSFKSCERVWRAAKETMPVSGKRPIATAPKGIPVIVAGGLAMQKTGGAWFSGMEEPQYCRMLQWQPKWWMPIITDNDPAGE